jgi:hypothetical protein
MNRITIFIALIASITLFSCNKNNDREPIPGFSAEGFWRGSLSSGTGIAVLNRDNGTSRLYILTTSSDTATAFVKHDGEYGSNHGTQGYFHSEYLTHDGASIDHFIVETTRASGSSMLGVVTHTAVSDTLQMQSSYSFQLTKQ